MRKNCQNRRNCQNCQKFKTDAPFLSSMTHAGFLFSAISRDFGISGNFLIARQLA
jgi:hypothetical protein